MCLYHNGEYSQNAMHLASERLHAPLSAPSIFCETLRKERTSSFNLPVSPDLSISYNSSFSSWRLLTLCVSAAVVLFEVDPVAADELSLIWGRRSATKDGGKERGSVVEGLDWLDRYWRRWVTSS